MHFFPEAIADDQEGKLQKTFSFILTLGAVHVLIEIFEVYVS